MQNWYMMTLVGSDRPGIVARVSQKLFEGGCNLGETSMIRLGGAFTIMMMVSSERGEQGLHELLQPVAADLGLHLHVVAFDGGLHRHQTPDVRVTVFGADRAGIVAQVTGLLAKSGFNITDLESDVGGSEERPIYILHIEGISAQSVEALQATLAEVTQAGIDVHVDTIDTLIG